MWSTGSCTAEARRLCRNPSQRQQGRSSPPPIGPLRGPFPRIGLTTRRVSEGKEEVLLALLSTTGKLHFLLEGSAWVRHGRGGGCTKSCRKRMHPSHPHPLYDHQRPSRTSGLAPCSMSVLTGRVVHVTPTYFPEPASGPMGGSG